MKPLKIEYTQIADKQNGLLPYLAECVKMLIRNKDEEGLQQLINDVSFVADSLFDLNDQAAAAQVKFMKENARLKEAERKLHEAQEEAERIRKQMTESFGDPEADKEEMSGVADIFGNALTTDSLLDALTLDAVEDKNRIPTKDEILQAAEGLGISFGNDDMGYSSDPLVLGGAPPALGGASVSNVLGDVSPDDENTEEETNFEFTTDDFNFTFDDVDFSVPIEEANSTAAPVLFGEDSETFDDLFPEENETDTGGVLFTDDYETTDDYIETPPSEPSDPFASDDDDDDDFDFGSGSLIDTL